MAKPKRSRKIRKPKTTDLAAMVETLGPCPPAPHTMPMSQRDDVARARVRWQTQLAELIAQHRRRSRMHDVEALQERNSPTVSIAVDDPEATRRARRNLTRVRQSRERSQNQGER